MREVKEVLSAAAEHDDILVIREEYKKIYERLKTENENNNRVGGFAMTGHPGIGLYKCWFCLK